MTYRGFSKKRNIFIPLLVCIGYFLIFSPFNADASDTGEKEIRLTLSQVVEFALATDSQILDAQDNVKVAQSNRRIAQKEKGFNPTVQVTGDIALSLIHISEPTRLLSISYAVFCLKKKIQNPTKQNEPQTTLDTNACTNLKTIFCPAIAVCKINT
mgnify:CR=1 FL=1